MAAIESVASNNTKAVINKCPVVAGKGKYTFREYNSKLCVRLSLDNKPVMEVFQAKAQPSATTLGSTDTATLIAVADHK